MSSVSINSAAKATIDIDVAIAFDGFHLSLQQQLPAQAITGIFGHSGSGKSTLLRILTGLEKRAQGQINFAEQCLLNTRNKVFIKPEQRNIAIVFQDSRLFPHLSVIENLAFAAKRCKNSALKIEDIVELTDLTALADKGINQLSGGEKQRVALARAILAEPKLLLLDEPLSALDNHNKALLLSLLTKVQQQLNIPIFYVSHSMAELQQVADHLLVLEQGKVVDFGNIHQVIHRLNYPTPLSKPEQENGQESGQSNLQPATFSGLTQQQTSLALQIKAHHPEYGLTSLAVNHNSHIYLPLLTNKTKLGSEVRCFILANDISITLTEPSNSSIVNHLSGKVSEIQQQQHSVLLTISCAEHDFYTRITALSFQQLQLKINAPVYIQFKASAVKTFNYSTGE